MMCEGTFKIGKCGSESIESAPGGGGRWCRVVGR